MHTAWAKASIAAFAFASAFGSGAFASDFGSGARTGGSRPCGPAQRNVLDPADHVAWQLGAHV
jgi:hypothetical protein